MRRNSLVVMFGVAIIATVLLTSVFASAKEMYTERSAYTTQAGGGYIFAGIKTYWDDVTYVINAGKSSTTVSYTINSPGTCSLQEKRGSITTYNTEAYVRVDYFPSSSAAYGMYATAWGYPSYTSNQWGASWDLWYI